MLYGGRRLPLRAPRAKPAPSATQIAPTTVKPMYNAQSEPEKRKKWHCDLMIICLVFFPFLGKDNSKTFLATKPFLLRIVVYIKFFTRNMQPHSDHCIVWCLVFRWRRLASAEEAKAGDKTKNQRKTKMKIMCNIKTDVGLKWILMNYQLKEERERQREKETARASKRQITLTNDDNCGKCLCTELPHHCHRQTKATATAKLK